MAHEAAAENVPTVLVESLLVQPPDAQATETPAAASSPVAAETASPAPASSAAEEATWFDAGAPAGTPPPGHAAPATEAPAPATDPLDLEEVELVEAEPLDEPPAPAAQASGASLPAGGAPHGPGAAPPAASSPPGPALPETPPAAEPDDPFAELGFEVHETPAAQAPGADTAAPPPAGPVEAAPADPLDAFEYSPSEGPFNGSEDPQKGCFALGPDFEDPLEALDEQQEKDTSLFGEPGTLLSEPEEALPEGGVIRGQLIEEEEAAEAAPRAPTFDGTFVQGEHTVAIHTMSGEVRRGRIRDCDLMGPTLVLLPTASDTAPAVIPRDRIRAVLFTRRPGTPLPSASGPTVRVKFPGGREVTGKALSQPSQSHGFFLVPQGPMANSTSRIFVYPNAGWVQAQG
ncbi:MAG: hypothetical protein D6729_19890 [Deltaproteobacteria bacterium]|nr:MAG: hypothetical protein D6729_19890 [Deltaproteobacteria bacterium]